MNFSPLEGLKVYNDGVEVGGSHTLHGRSNNCGDGRIAIGQRYTWMTGGFASVGVDELLFFNEALSEDQIIMLKEYTISE